MGLSRFIRKPKFYSQLEISKQISDISELMEQRKEGTDNEREELDSQIEIAQYVLSHMLSRHQKRIKDDL